MPGALVSGKTGSFVCDAASKEDGQQEDGGAGAGDGGTGAGDATTAADNGPGEEEDEFAGGLL